MVTTRAYRRPDVLSLKFMDCAAPLSTPRDFWTTALDVSWGGQGSERCSRRSAGVKVQATLLYFFFPLVKTRHLPLQTHQLCRFSFPLSRKRCWEAGTNVLYLCKMKKKDGGFSEGKEFPATGLNILQEQNQVGDYFWQSLAIY